MKDQFCSKVDMELLLELSAGRLDPARAQSLTAHAKNCPDCSAFLSAQSEVWDALDIWEPAPVSVDFNRELWRKIEAADRAPWYRKLMENLRYGAWRPAVPVAAALAFFAVGFVLDHGTRAPSVQVASISGSGWGVSVIEADQVESSLEDIQLLRLLE